MPKPTSIRLDLENDQNIRQLMQKEGWKFTVALNWILKKHFETQDSPWKK